MIPLHLKVLDADPGDAQDSIDECGVCREEIASCLCLDEQPEDSDDI